MILKLLHKNFNIIFKSLLYHFDIMFLNIFMILDVLDFVLYFSCSQILASLLLFLILNSHLPY